MSKCDCRGCANYSALLENTHIIDAMARFFETNNLMSKDEFYILSGINVIVPKEETICFEEFSSDETPV